MDESGVPDQQSELIIGVLVPAATPKPIVDLLQRQIARIVVAFLAVGQVVAMDALPITPLGVRLVELLEREALQDLVVLHHQPVSLPA